MTSLAEQEAQIVADLTTIRDLWDRMLPTIAAIPLGRNGGSKPTGARTSSGKGKDNSDKNTDVTNLDIVMSDRRHTTEVLAGWTAQLIQDNHLTHDLPTRHNIPKMCAFLERWARHITGTSYAQDLADELHECATTTLRHAKPVDRSTVAVTTRDILTEFERTRTNSSMYIGQCPIEKEHEDGTLAPCGGNVYAYPLDGRDPRCSRCKTPAVIEWWQSHMIGNPAAKPLVTATELIGVIAFQLHWTVTHGQIRQWAARGKIERAGKDSKGRTLYDHEAVTAAIRDEVARMRQQREKAGA